MCKSPALAAARGFLPCMFVMSVTECRHSEARHEGGATQRDYGANATGLTVPLRQLA
jgi:hypothetical protein